MKIAFLGGLLCTLFVAQTAIGGMTSESYNIPNPVLSGGSSTSSSTNYSVVSTLGQPVLLEDASAPPQSESFDLYSGMWYAIDTDGDLVFDTDDNCLNVVNEYQVDSDVDGIGNMCDCDFNQDNFCGGPDFTIFVGCFNALTNGDAKCEAADMNGDGFVGGPDFTRFIGGFNGAPGPAAAAVVP